MSLADETDRVKSKQMNRQAARNFQFHEICGGHFLQPYRQIEMVLHGSNFNRCKVFKP